MARILSLGSSLQDIYLIDHDDFRVAEIGSETIYAKIPVGGKADIDRVAYEIGGGAVNSATTFARHGHEAIILSAISNDAAGQAIRMRLDEENIDSSYLHVMRGDTGCSVILLDSKSGERTVLTHRGVSASGVYDAKLIEEIAPDWLYVTSVGGDLEMLVEIFKVAHKIGAKVMFNPGKKELKQQDKILKLLAQVDILLVNRKEAAMLVPGVTLQDLLPRLMGYCDTVLITDGPMGGIASNGEAIYRFGLYADLRVKDATGAGDAFGSGFLAHFADKYSFRTSLVFASANSTSVVAKIGASRGALEGHEDLHPMPIQKIELN